MMPLRTHWLTLATSYFVCAEMGAAAQLPSDPEYRFANLIPGHAEKADALAHVPDGLTPGLIVTIELEANADRLPDGIRGRAKSKGDRPGVG